MSAVTARVWRGALFMILIGILGVAETQAQKDPVRDAVQQYRFQIEIEGVNAGRFRSVSGLAIESEVVDYREGGDNGTIHKLFTGTRKYSNIVLKRGFTGSPALYNWYMSSTAENPGKVNGRIIVFDSHDVKVAQWEFVSGFPVKWEGPDYDASANEVAIETIEIAHEGLTMVPPELL
ncbi:MAG TPA: phage tail protein [Terriglobia bacterium]|nr:phage tail protein [Terriglobia bacterium]